jgi:hypothetical protein
VEAGRKLNKTKQDHKSKMGNSREVEGEGKGRWEGKGE